MASALPVWEQHAPTLPVQELTFRPWHGAFMEPSGRNRWQPVANGTSPKRAEIGGSATVRNRRQPPEL